MRALGLDIGTVRIGIAQSDMLGMLASNLETYTRKYIKVDVAHIVQIIQQNNINTVVVGLPLKMNGEEGQSVQMVKDFVQELQAQLQEKNMQIPIVYQDERLTTVSAERVLLSANVRRAKSGISAVNTSGIKKLKRVKSTPNSRPPRMSARFIRLPQST